MSHSFVNVVATLPIRLVDEKRAAIATLLGNPAHDDVKTALDSEGVHFASMHALAGSDGKRGHLLIEFSADGEDAGLAIDRVCGAIGSKLAQLFDGCDGWSGADGLDRFMKKRQIVSGHGLFQSTGLPFAGTPGMDVPRIRDEAHLRREVETWLAEQGGDERPLERVREIRRKIVGSDLDWALQLPAPPIPATSPPPGNFKKISSLGLGAFKSYLWPFFVPALFMALLAGASAHGFGGMIIAALCTFLKWGGLTLIVIVALAGFLVWRLRALEKADWVNDRTLDRRELAEILKRENHFTQNHMISQTIIKPGLLRTLFAKLAFFAIGGLTAINGRPGFLGEIGTIHFARWLTLPGTRDLVFVSNFDGSWESYLEDFITKAHDGLTAAWSSTVGFPRTEFLFAKGATDGERFKQFARHSMIHSAFWYSAYPDISTDQVRANALIRQGIARAESDDEAASLLSLFGSAIRPPAKIESSQVQSIVFGGMGGMPYAHCLLASLPDNPAKAKTWLAEIMPDIAFNDGRQFGNRKAVVILACGPGGLTRLGLPEGALETFPAAFVDTMAAPGRDRILGDTGTNQASQWAWGKTTPDLAILIYGEDEAAFNAMLEDVTTSAKRHGLTTGHEIRLTKVPDEPAERKEPFGFLDGVSQPLIKGTYRATRYPDPKNLVEPGEFILGYPDNRGNLPPGPRLAVVSDPDQRLPTSKAWDFLKSQAGEARDIGRNGSYLVIRQLEQDVTKFQKFCAEEATRLKDRLPPPYEVTPDFIGAKMVGRWPDGSAIVRWPYESETAYRARIRPDKKPVANVENDFDFGTEDPEGLRCPYGAHIRRTNPRDSQSPGQKVQIDISNRHRILRTGRLYTDETGKDPKPSGLLFMCLNADIERQFEFIQQTWANSGHFHGLDGEIDPVIGSGNCRFTIPTRDGPMVLQGLQQFVTTRGGGYFFLPSKRLLAYLAGSATLEDLPSLPTRATKPAKSRAGAKRKP